MWRYFTSTGDQTTLLALYPSASHAVDWLWSTRQAGTGLLYGLADTDNGDPVYGYDLAVAADTASNVLAANAMGRVAQIATVAGDTATAELWQTRATQLTDAVNGVLRRPDGTYVDGVDANGAQSTHASQEANALALAYGVVPASDLAAVGDYVAGLGIDVGPNHGLELLRGLAAANMPAAMVRLLTDTSIPGWAHIVAAGGTFTWEVWRPSDLIGDSLSHGWGSSALVAMQETLLGVDPRAAQRGRHGQRHDRAAVGRPRPRRGIRPDHRRSGAAGLAASREGHDDGPHRARQRHGDGAVARRRRRQRARGRHGGGQGTRRHRDVGRGGVVVLSVGSGTYRFTSS